MTGTHSAVHIKLDLGQSQDFNTELFGELLQYSFNRWFCFHASFSSGCVRTTLHRFSASQKREVCVPKRTKHLVASRASSSARLDTSCWLRPCGFWFAVARGCVDPRCSTYACWKTSGCQGSFASISLHGQAVRLRLSRTMFCKLLL